ncbi:collagenase [Streptomyces sp. NBC_00094]|uniref:collagenase n=1 Tax=Streptomyces sp. NBC_00094 TaxID=2903620 RepID=UPI002258BE83|nr:collagenase [Streptomyces sp. NBC_00094]MCX5388609.1 collagenase [Streptomyces sp. NBC_00094]
MASAGQSAVTAAGSDDQPATATPLAGPAAPQAQPQANPFDEVDHLANATVKTFGPAPAPGGLANGRVAGKAKATTTAATKTTAKSTAKADTAARSLAADADTTAAGVPCTLNGVTGLSPEAFADFLADPAVTVECVNSIVWTWDARLVPVMSDAHVQAVARRISSLAASHDGNNSSHLEQMFTYLHAVVYHDFSRGEIDVTDAATVGTITKAVTDFGAAARTFDVTKSNATTLREALYAASGPGLRAPQIGLIKRVLATMDPSHPATNQDASWAGAALAGLSVNYLGVYSGNNDSAFQAAAAADPAYRALFKAFAGYSHLKGTVNDWVARDALSEYGRFGQIASLKTEIVAALGPLLGQTVTTFGRGSQQWGKIVSWLNYFEACQPYGVCKADIEAQIFPYTYTYDGGKIKVRTGLDRATVDQLYYASKQVKAQYHRVIGTETPLTGDVNTTLNIVLYGSRADYEIYHPIITPYDTNNGGIYIENGATFYTYQRRVPQDSSLTLEELFRHEYVHYLNGRFAVPGTFGQGPWYQGDRTTAMDEGTAEFFDGATRDNGIAVRKSLVRGIINDTAGGGPRMSVNQILRATYSGDGFRFYNYAGTFFEFLWTERPTLLREMYTHLRNDDVTAYDSWRSRLGADSGLQQAYDRFLDTQIAKVDTLYVPNTTYTANGYLRDVDVSAVRTAFANATANTPDCVEAGEYGKRRFVCTGRITANLSDANNSDKVFKDMSETVDYFILDRAGAVSNNLADMNCSFGPVDIWPSRVAGTSSFNCEGPLRS